MRTDLLYGFFKWLFIVIGAFFSYLKPTIPFVLICLFATILDCYSAYALSRRVRIKNPRANDGKFKSKYASKVFSTIIKAYALIALAYLIDTVIMPSGMYLPNIVAGMFCFVQIWSFLENESSENSSKWAKVMQRIMVNKAERHFDVPIQDILSDKNENKKEQYGNN